MTDHIKQQLLEGTASVALSTLSVDPEATYKEREAADFLNVSVRTLQAWRVRGGGPVYVKMNRSVRYKRRALIEFQKAREVASTTEADARENGR